MTTYYHIQVGALETQEFRTIPVPYWLVCFSDTTKGPMRQMFFVVLLPDGTVVEPRVARRCRRWSDFYGTRNRTQVVVVVGQNTPQA